MLSLMGRRRQSNLDLPPRMHQKGEMYYYVTGTRPRKWIKLDADLNKARTLWAQLEGKASAQGGFATALDAWMVSARFNGLADASKIAYRKVHEPLKKFFDGADLQTIKPNHIADWLDNHPSPVLANIGRALVSNVMQAAVRKGVIDRNPCKDIVGLHIKSRTRYMTDAEFVAIRSCANDLVRACMDIGYLTGMRIADILKIQLADIKDDGLYLTQQKTGKKQVFTMTSNLKFALDSAKALPRSVRNMTHLLCTRKGTPYTYTSVNVSFREAKIKSGVTDVRFHDIRAKAATDAKRQGLDYQAMLGHTNPAMSERYVRSREFQQVSPLKKAL